MSLPSEAPFPARSLTSSPSPSSRTYDVHGEPLVVSCADASLHRSIETVLRHKGILPVDDCPLGAVDAGSPRRKLVDATDGSDGLHLMIERVARSRPLPNDAEWLGTCAGSILDVYRCKGTLQIVGSEGQAHIDLNGRRARVELSPQFVALEKRGPTLVFTHLIGFSLVELLKTQKWIPLHAAVLARDGRGLVLLAESDSGKSTTAFQLVRHGWSYVSDDSVLLRATEAGEIEAVSLRPHFCLDAAAARHFPELSGHDWPVMVREEVKWRVDTEQLYPGRRIPSCRPAAVVVPSISGAPTSALSSAPPTDILPILLQQSGFVATTGQDRLSVHFQLLGGLLKQCTTHRLDSGRDLLDDGPAADRLLRPLLA